MNREYVYHVVIASKDIGKPGVTGCFGEFTIAINSDDATKKVMRLHSLKEEHVAVAYAVRKSDFPD